MSVLDGLMDFLALKAKPARKDENEDEYTLPVLGIGDFPMSDALLRRKQCEELCKRYGLQSSKEGGFV